MLMDKKRFQTTIGETALVVELSDVAEQANGAVLIRYGETAVLVTSVMGKKDTGGDFLPLTVEYEERYYAAGKILGSRFMRREGRAPDDAILSARLIDRTIRPLFDYRMRREVQVIATILSFDEEHSHEFASLIGASVALAISDIPWAGPVAGVPVAQIDGAITIAPGISALPKATYEAFVAGTKDFINMIECESREVDEKTILAGFDAAQIAIQQLVAFQEKIVKEVGKKKVVVKLAESSLEIVERVRVFCKERLPEAIYVRSKAEREVKMRAVKEALTAHLKENGTDDAGIRSAESFWEILIDEIVHKNILENGKRPDLRAMDEVRTLSCETHLFERVHGSALFARGNTQALAMTTLASTEAGKLIETIDYTGTKNFLLHYNFPPYSVGEVKPLRGPGRREIGHGALAEKAIKNMLPNKEEFPYTIRVVSEILSSNGSSSMATVCATSMSLMDAGVPIKKAVAGIAMGLMSDDEGNYKILTDLQGPEDFFGDMDFKVAGTGEGVTAIQLDVKIRGLTLRMIEETLRDARVARLKILDTMAKAIAAPRKELSKYAPVILTLPINPEKIGLLIGPGGKTINGIIAKTGALAIDIDESGKVFIAGATRAIAEATFQEVEMLMKEYKVGDVVHGKIIKILEFGAIVDLGGGNDGMIHVSELKSGFVKKVEEVVNVGDEVFAKVIRVEDGRIGLSLKNLPQQ